MMRDLTELKERLRFGDDSRWVSTAATCAEAADAITELEARVAGLEEKVRELQGFSRINPKTQDYITKALKGDAG